MLLTSILLQRKRLHTKLELRTSVLELDTPSSKSTEVTLLYLQ